MSKIDDAPEKEKNYDAKTEKIPQQGEALAVGGTSSQSRSNQLPRRSFIANMPDKGLFGLVSLVGFALIIVLKLYGYSSELVAIVAVSVMIIYGWIAYKIPAIQLRLDRLGDNFYYLGFILTLASMSAALLQLRLSEEPDMNVIIGNFGVALFTTIVGIAGRVVFVQMRSELDDVESAIRQDILSRNMELRGQMSAAIREFEMFRIAMRQSMEEQQKQDLEAYGELSKDYVKSIEKVTQHAVENLEKIFGGRESTVTILAKKIDELAEMSDQLRNRLSSFDSPLDGLHQMLTQFNQDLWPLLQTVLRGIEESQSGRRRWWQFGRRRRSPGR